MSSALGATLSAATVLQNLKDKNTKLENALQVLT